MALLDEKRETLVVRIVYDGPPFSGKTTTLRALSNGFSRTLESPEEHDGRTLYFDWLDYTAGRFEGRPIRCQVVSVPGQRSLIARRRRLLRDADSIVFVADTGSLGLNLSLRYAQELRGLINSFDQPHPGIVIQANKRDVDDALPVPEILNGFRSVGVEAALVETSATSGSGVREAFLFGVRLALDRARELNARGLLRSGRPHIDSSGDLLRELTGSDADERQGSTPTRPPGGPIGQGRAPPPTPAPNSVGAILREGLASEHGLLASAQVRHSDISLPDPSAPSGLIWPPVEGRIIVQQALAATKLEIRQLPSGDCCVDSPNGWRLHSRARDLFSDQNNARSALVEWARLHVRNQSLLSERRCVVLSVDEDRWRLWQIVGQARSLEEFLTFETDETSVRKAAAALLVAATKLIAAAQTFDDATIALRADLRTVAAESAEPRYVDLMPAFDAVRTTGAQPDVTVPKTFILDRMTAPITDCIERFGRDPLLAEFAVIGESSGDGRQVVDVLRDAVCLAAVA